MHKLLLVVLCLIPCKRLLVEGSSIVINEKYRLFMKEYCVNCHNAEKQKGDLSLDSEGFSFEISTPKQADQWQHILSAINSKEMPPENKKQPNEQDKLEFLEMLSAKLVEARSMLSDSGGKITMRRLNRREYKNTMESLLGVTVNVSGLPDDFSNKTFDTNGSSLFISSDQIEKYLSIARSSISRAIKKEELEKPVTIRIEPETKVNEHVTKRYKDYLNRNKSAVAYEIAKEKGINKKPKEFGLVDEREVYFAKDHYERFFAIYDHYLKNPQTKSGIIPSLWHPIYDASFKIDSAKLNITVKNKNGTERKKSVRKKLPEGLYKIRCRVARFPNVPMDRSFLDFGYVDDKFHHLKTFHITAKLDQPQIVEEMVLIGPENRRLSFREKAGGENAYYKYGQDKKKNGVGPPPGLWIDWFEYEGPFKAREEAQLKNQLEIIQQADFNDGKVKTLLQEFCRHVYRDGEVSNNYISTLKNIFDQEVSAGKKYQDAIIEPLAVILSSPRFLFLAEPSKDKETRKLTQRELATRLSYFLWGSPPDKKLSMLAKLGKLTDQSLREQADRMLKDQRSMNFIRSFSYQWLGMERLHFFKFDASLDFDGTLKTAAAEEVYHTLKYVIDHGLSTEKLLKSEFVVVNGLMANHYGLNGVIGHEYRKVALPQDSVRGGLTGMAAILAMGSDGKHSSPIERGAWVLRKILNRPPPPAPANVPQLSRLHDKALSAREILKIHQEEAQCSHCHSKIDPIGVGLENFDPTGKWRTEVEVGRGKRKRNEKIDASGTLYRGPDFRNYRELRNIFHSKVDDFNRGLITSLLSYSLSREVGFTDQDLIDGLHRDMKKNGNSLRWLIQEILHLEAFRTKK